MIKRKEREKKRKCSFTKMIHKTKRIKKKRQEDEREKMDFPCTKEMKHITLWNTTGVINTLDCFCDWGSFAFFLNLRDF